MGTLSIKPCDQHRGDRAYQSYTLDAGNSNWPTTPPILSQEDLACIRWYFEDFVEKEPFEDLRASDAKDLLKDYGIRLAKSLELWRCPVSFLDSQIRLYFEADSRPEQHSKAGFWECLENLALWPFQRRPRTVTVIRRVKRSKETQISAVPQIWLPSLSGQINILIVYARPQGARDIPHRLVSRAVLEAAAQSRRLVHIDIVRPGTFDAYVEHLRTRPFGCYQLVHFDVHGVERDNKWVLSIFRDSMLISFQNLAEFLEAAWPRVWS